MSEGGSRRTFNYSLRMPRSWPARIACVIALAAFTALAFFFLVFFAVIGSVMLAVLAVRWWWIARRVPAERSASSIDGEFRVVSAGEPPALEDRPGEKQ